MKFEPIDYEMIVALNIKRIFFIVENTEEGITFEQLKKSEDLDEGVYSYWNSSMDEWSDGGYEIQPDRQYYILTRD